MNRRRSAAKPADSRNPHPLDPALVSRFMEAAGRRGVPEIAARALLRKIRETAALTRLGKMSDQRACLVVVKLLLATEDKAAELARVQSKQLARDLAAGKITIAEMRSQLRGAA